MLVVVDNARETGQVTPLLPGGATCTVLITSRRRVAGLTVTHGARLVPRGVLPGGDARPLRPGHLAGRRQPARPASRDDPDPAARAGARPPGPGARPRALPPARPAQAARDRTGPRSPHTGRTAGGAAPPHRLLCTHRVRRRPAA